MLADDLEDEPLADGHTGIGHTRWATHGGPTDGNAHPHLGDDGKLALIHNGIIENFAELKDELLDAGASLHERDRHRGRGALWSAASTARPATSPRRFRRVVARLEGAFTLLVMHQDQPGVVVGARRNSPLVIGLGEGENFLGSDVAAFVEHTKRAMAIGQDQIVTITPRLASRSPTSPATPSPTREFEVAWDASAAEKGGWSSFMAKEISEEPEAVAQDPARPRARRPASPSPSSTASRDMLDEHRPHHRHRLRHRRLRRHARQVRDRAVVARARRGRARARVPLPRPGARRRTRSSSRSASRARPWTPSWPSSTPGSRARARCRSATRRASTIPRESDAVIYTHAGPEVAVASTKAFVAQVTALYLLGLHLAQRARHPRRRRRSPSSVDELQAIPAKIDQVLESTATASRELAPLDGRHPVGAVPRPPRRLPGRARGRAEAQGARVHPRRGLRRRRAEARPDRADRARPARLRDRAVAARTTTRCTRRSSRTSRRSAPAAPA